MIVLGNTIKINPPAPKASTFWFVGPIPPKDKFELFGAKFNMELSHTKLNVILVGWFEYQVAHMSEMHTLAAYGYTVKEMQDHLRTRYCMHDHDKVAFYLFRKLAEQPIAEPAQTNLEGFFVE